MLAYLDTLIGFGVVMLVISLLITILTQIVSALVNHRGCNLLWGLKTLFVNIDPSHYPVLTAKAGAVAESVLTHCLISDSWFSDNKVAIWLGSRIPLLETLFRRFQLASAISPAELTDILGHLADHQFAGTDPQLAAEIRNLAGTTPLAVAAAAGQAAQAAVTTVQTDVAKLEMWFDSIMDRVSEKFSMYMRIWTVAFAALFAFGTGLNSVQLMNELYTNGAFRNALVGAGQQVMASAGKVLDAKNSLGAKYAEVLQQALQDAKVTPAQPPPAVLATPDQVAAWIRQYVPSAQQADVQQRFNTAAIPASQAFVQGSIDDATKVSAIASTAGFEVLKYRWPKSPSLRYIFGVFATAGLLSLGAPFWFNALKSMTNLRSVVASKQDPQA